MRVVLLASTKMDFAPTGYVWQPSPDVTDPDELAEAAGRLCYLSWKRPNPDTATNEGYLANIIAQRHFSVLEHASASFYIDGVTRNFTHELIRHRHLSFSEVSQRYVDVSDFSWALHPGLVQWLDTDAETDQGREEWLRDIDSTTKEAYERIVKDLVEHHGYKRKEARQAARHVLPSSTETKIIVSGNLRAWREVLEKRLSPAADAEFREVAQKILAELREIAPNTFQDFDTKDWMEE